MISPCALSPDEPADEDDRLLRRWAASADHDALQRLVERLTPAAWAVAQRIAGRDLAEDAVWTGFARAARAARSCRGQARAWILVAVANAARNARRGAGRRERGEGRAPAPAPQRDRDPLEIAEAAVLVHRALGELPEHERLPIALVHLDGLAVDEAAAVLGRGARTVRTQMRRGLERLRALLATRGASLSVAALSAALAQGREAPPADAASRLLAFASQASPPHASAWPSWMPIAIGACAAALVIGGMAWVWAWGGDAGGSPAPVRPGAVAGAAADPPVGTAHVDPLDQPVTVRFMRERIADALAHIAERIPGGLTYAFPLDEQPERDARFAFGVSWTPPAGVSLRSVLDGLAQRTGMEWQQCAGVIVFHRPIASPAREQILHDMASLDHGGLPWPRRHGLFAAVAGDLDIRRAAWIALTDGNINLMARLDSRHLLKDLHGSPCARIRSIDAAFLGDERLRSRLRQRLSRALPAFTDGSGGEPFLFRLAGVVGDGDCARILSRHCRDQQVVRSGVAHRKLAGAAIAWLAPLTRTDEDAAQQAGDLLAAWSGREWVKSDPDDETDQTASDVAWLAAALAEHDTPTRRSALERLSEAVHPAWRAAAHDAWIATPWGAEALHAASAGADRGAILRRLMDIGRGPGPAQARILAAEDPSLLTSLARHGSAEDLGWLLQEVQKKSARPALRGPVGEAAPWPYHELSNLGDGIASAWSERSDSAGLHALAGLLTADGTAIDLLSLAARILANARSPEGQRLLADLVPQLTGSAREAAIWAMITSRDEPLVVAALAGLSTGALPCRERIRAYWRLEFDERRPSRALVECLAEQALGSDATAAGAAVEALLVQSRQVPAIGDWLVRIATSSQAERIRGMAVGGLDRDAHAQDLCRLGALSEAPFLRAMAWHTLHDSRDPDVKAAAAQRLADEDDPRVRAYLLLANPHAARSRLRDDPDPRIRAVAAALCAGPRLLEDPASPGQVESLLITALEQEPDAIVRKAIGRALRGGVQGTIDGSGLRETLIDEHHVEFRHDGLKKSTVYATPAPEWSDAWLTLAPGNG